MKAGEKVPLSCRFRGSLSPIVHCGVLLIFRVAFPATQTSDGKVPRHHYFQCHGDFIPLPLPKIRTFLSCLNLLTSVFKMAFNPPFYRSLHHSATIIITNITSHSYKSHPIFERYYRSFSITIHHGRRSHPRKAPQATFRNDCSHSRLLVYLDTLDSRHWF